jgi:quinol monooxygenase YgiN
MQINLTAIIKSLPEKVGEMKVILLDLVESSKKEAACIKYDLHQAAEMSNVFIFHEIWQDAQSLEQHNRTTHVLKFIKDAGPLLAEAPEIHITNKIS